MDATPTRTPTSEGLPEGEAAGTVDALALVRRIRDDFATRSAGLSDDELIALIRDEASTLRRVPPEPDAGREAA